MVAPPFPGVPLVVWRVVNRGALRVLCRAATAVDASTYDHRDTFRGDAIGDNAQAVRADRDSARYLKTRRLYREAGRHAHRAVAERAAIENEGEVGAGDEMRVISSDPNGVPVSEITRLYAEKRYSNADVTWVQRALRVAALPESWKEYFRQRLEQIPTL